MPKVAITGHTSGLGAALFERFSVSDDVVGLSRSNGFDIRDINGICERVKDCDVFINNDEAILEMLQRFNEALSYLQRAIRWK